MQTGNEVRFRRAAVDDAPVLAKTRVAMYREWWSGIRDEERFSQEATAFVARGLREGWYLGWFAEDETGKVVASVGAHVREIAPTPSRPTAFEARLQGFYVEPSHRRFGIGRSLVGHAIKELRDREVLRIVVRPSEDVMPIVRSFDFLPSQEYVLSFRG